MIISKSEINRIRKDREGVVNSNTFAGIKALVSELYSDDAHFIYELLQNAEDASAQKVIFELFPDKLLFMHNGTKQFDIHDIDSITSISSSTKKDNYIQAGKFGIGFKSVYSFTNTPSIYCDTVSFRIISMMIPELIDSIKDREKGWTVFVFPFDSERMTAGYAYSRISKGLSDIDSSSLLFLNNISEIRTYSNGEELNSIRRITENHNVLIEVLSGNKAGNLRKWLRYSKAIKIEGKPSEIDVAFEYKDKDSIEYKSVRNGVFIKFVAKKERSDLNYYINAPFSCTPSRESINETDATNVRLIRELAKLSVSAISDIHKKGLLNYSILSSLPDIKNVSTLYYPIAEALIEGFKKKAIIPSCDGKYVSGEYAVLKSDNKIDNSLDIESLRRIYDCDKLQYIDSVKRVSAGYAFVNSVVKRKVSAEDITIRLSYKDDYFINDLFSSYSDVELRILYEILGYGLDCIINGEYSESAKQEIIENYKKLSIVRTEHDGLLSGIQVYSLSEGVEKVSRVTYVRSVLCRSNWSRFFLEQIGVKNFTSKDFNKYQDESEQNQFIRILSKIGISGGLSPNEIAQKIIDYIDHNGTEGINWSSYKFIWTGKVSDKKYTKSKYKSIDECYLDIPHINESGLRFAEDIHHKIAVSTIYSKMDPELYEKWICFLINNGIYNKFKVFCVSKDTGYTTGEDIDFIMPYLDKYFDLFQKRKILAINLWNVLIGEWNSSYNNKVYRLNKSQPDKIEDSTLLKLLKNNKWVLSKNGRLYKPSEICIDELSDDLIWNDNSDLIKAIELGKKIKEKEDRRLAKEIKEKEVAKSLGLSDAEELLKARDAYKVIMELTDAGVDINELYDSVTNKRKAKATKSIIELFDEKKDIKFIREIENNLDDYVAPIKRIDKRVGKLNEIMDTEGVSYVTKVKVNSKKIISKEEKCFLKAEYNGKCQICSKTIIKKNGTCYFEAINILDTSLMNDNDLKGLSIGWNSLCLCPNHAAEYMYGAISLYDFVNWVLNIDVQEKYDDFYTYEIKLQGKKKTIRFTPKHLLAIKVALQKLSK